VLAGFLGGVIVSSSPPVAHSLPDPAIDVTAANASLDWCGIMGDSLCSNMCPRCHLCSLVPQMVDREASLSSPSGDEKIADSAVQFCGSCDEVHKRIQVRICDSDAPIVVQILVRRVRPLLSFCLFGFS
jgi:hypothetical protein